MPANFDPARYRGLMSNQEVSEACRLISREIRQLCERKEETQVRNLLRISGFINNLFDRPALEVQIGWILERYRVWRNEMSVVSRCRYLTQLVAWRSIQGSHDGMWMAYFLPGIHLFQRLPPSNNEASLNDNWFVWWFSEGQTLDLPPSQEERTERNREMDKWFLDYIAFHDKHGPDTDIEMPIRDYSSRYRTR